MWPSATKWVKDHPVRRQEPDPALARLTAEVDELPRPGRSGPSTRALYIAMIEKATAVGELRFNASQRDLMRRSVYSRKTVQGALKRLEDRNLVERRGRTAGRSSAEADPERYSLTSIWQLGTDHLPPQRAQPRHPSSTVSGHVGIGADAFLNGTGLGKNAHRVWTARGRSPGPTPRHLSRDLGIDLRTVKATCWNCRSRPRRRQRRGSLAGLRQALGRRGCRPWKPWPHESPLSPARLGAGQLRPVSGDTCPPARAEPPHLRAQSGPSTPTTPYR